VAAAVLGSGPGPEGRLVQWTNRGSDGRSPGGEADHIRDEADYVAHVRYCWVNPVKHGFVGRPEDWPYSSVQTDARYVRGMDLGLPPER